jgi:CBS-domain-containing membrane protein
MWGAAGNRFDDVFERIAAPLRRARPGEGKREFSIRTVVVGVMIGLTVLSGMERSTGNLLVIGSFGASSILLFAVPDSEFAQPWNVVGGHVLSSLVGLLAYKLTGGAWWSIGPTVGVALWVMLATKTLHPPAGADPIIMIARQSADAFFVTTTVLLGTTILVLLATAWHAKVTGLTFPDEEQRKVRP